MPWTVRNPRPARAIAALIAITTLLPSCKSLSGGVGTIVQRVSLQRLVAAPAPPTIALVFPPPGEALQKEHPVIVFRFTPASTSDVIDAFSLRVVIDGEDRSSFFRASDTSAWGTLLTPANAPLLDVGPHQVQARICSIRASCGMTTMTIAVKPFASAAPSPRP